MAKSSLKDQEAALKELASLPTQFSELKRDLTLAEKKRLFEKSSNINDVGLLADIVIMKALDKDGNKIFKSEDRLDIMHKVDSDVLAKISTSMVQSITPYEAKKK